MLAAMTAVTERIRVRSEVLLAPLRDPVLLAKQSAKLDRLSGGRFTSVSGSVRGRTTSRPWAPIMPDGGGGWTSNWRPCAESGPANRSPRVSGRSVRPR
ncbi:hypothetical protein ABH927_006599 [Planotetraspora sp. GP83]